MSFDQRHFSPIFSIDVSADQATEHQSSQIDANELLVMLLKQLQALLAALVEKLFSLAGGSCRAHRLQQRLGFRTILRDQRKENVFSFAELAAPEENLSRTPLLPIPLACFQLIPKLYQNAL